jgi:type II secretion system protein N
VVGIPVVAFALTAFFIVLGFPYHHLTDRATAFASQALGAEITAVDSGLSPGLDGPGFRFETVRVETSSGDIYRIDRARFGPAWSLSWLALTPTFFYEVESALGNTEGRILAGDEPGWSGSVTDADLAELHFIASALPVTLTGRLSAEGDVASSSAGYLGPLQFSAKEGILGHEALPVEIPFDTLHGAFTLGGQGGDTAGDTLVDIESLSLVGSLFRMTATGHVGRAAQPTNAPLDIRIEFSEVQPQVRSILELFGVRIDNDGRGSVHFVGTLASANFQTQP